VVSGESLANPIRNSAFRSVCGTRGECAETGGRRYGCRLHRSLYSPLPLRFSVIGWEPRAAAKAMVSEWQLVAGDYPPAGSEPHALEQQLACFILGGRVRRSVGARLLAYERFHS
jgi:hypothetical protein